MKLLYSAEMYHICYKVCYIVNTEIIITLTRIAGGASCPDTSTRIVSYLSKFMPV